jgi:diguanylate cyclase (GGDEF)-like protein/PAS domain S-box-containing protein
MKATGPAIASGLGALFFAAAAVYVWIRRGTSGWISLALMLLAGLLYSFTYALELGSDSLAAKQLWGDMKYIGVGLLPIAWLAFTLQYTGRARYLTPRLYALLSIEPVVILVLLAAGSTHDLIHVYPASTATERLPFIAFGPIGWVHVAYTYALLLATTGLFVVTLARIASAYRRPARMLILALAVPWALNALYVFNVGEFGRLDLTPFGFVLAGVVLVWGIFRLRLLEIAPDARRLALDNLRDGVVVLDAYRRIVELNPSAQRTSGITAPRAVGRHVLEVFPSLEPLLKHGPGNAEVSGEVKLVHPLGRTHHEVSIMRLPDQDGRSSGELVVLRDVSERTRALEQLREAESKYRALVEQVPAVVYIDVPQEGGDRTLYVSPQIETLLGLSPQAYMNDPFLWDKHCHREDRERVLREYQEGLRAGEPFSSEYRMVRPDGTEIWVRDDVVVLQAGPEEPKMIQGIIFDVTELKRAQEQAAFLAYHDALTGAPNRAMFEDTLQLALARARRMGMSVVVLYLDLDNFKLVNDSLGHAAGDEVLRQMMERLRQAVRDTDFIGRQGGDEFLILLADLERGSEDRGAHGPRPAEVAESVVGRIHGALLKPFVVMGNELYLSASIGASMYPDHGTDAQTLLRTADSAMYRSKRSGPAAYALFASTPDDAGNKLARVTALRRAVEDEDQWVLHYQPIVSLTEGRVSAAEALLRWRRPDGVLVPPAEFIPLAEELGFIVKVGDWVLDELFRQARAWREDGIDLGVTFNLSLRQLWQASFVNHLAGYLDAHQIPPSMVVAEITESIAMTDPDRTARVVRDIKGLGIQIAIDDFGTGYSSLSRLTSLPVDILKLDRQFIAGVPHDPQARRMANAVIQLALSLGMEPLAEGVEREDQRQFVADKGCRFAQGFLWTPAVPADDFVEWLRTRPSPVSRLASR